MTGTQIGNYKILEKLGEGGMGTVYKAVDINLERTVAIKALNAELTGNPELEKRFRAEAKAQANLNHTNLATLYALLIEEGRPWMVMEFIEGETFEQIVQRRGPIPSNEAVPLFRQALLGVGYAHRMGVVHRDIKPSNMMLNKQGIVKVMDFGIAKVLGARGMTKTGTQMGTAFYMSPEQVLNRGVDIRSDIYSLGVTLYELLTANVPFNGDSDYQIMTDHVNAPPPLPTKFYPYIPQGLQNAVLKALEKNPDARFQTVEEFGVALEQPDTFGVVPVEVVPAVVPAVIPGAIPAPRGATVVGNAPRGATVVETAAPVAAVVAAGASGVPAKAVFWTPERRIAGGGAAIILALVAGWAALRPNVKNTGLPTAPVTVTGSQATAPPADNGIPALPPVPPEPTRPAPAAPHAASRPAAGSNSALAIPAGTPVIVRLIDNVDSSRDRTGQRFAASVDAPVVVGGRTVIDRGAGARVVLINVTQAGAIEGRSEIKLELVSLSINGSNYVVRSNLFDQQGVARGKQSAKVIAGGAAVGAAIGGIFGKGKGAAVGAGAGAGGGAAAQMASKAPPVIVPAETRIKFTLRTPIS
jgi:eukaryotic-like serine/threonine-protein kinase